jgi:hypothetical protein
VVSYLDPIYECPNADITSVGIKTPVVLTSLQRHKQQQVVEWLLPDLVKLRFYYRWLKTLSEYKEDEINWEEFPSGLAFAYKHAAYFNFMHVFDEAGMIKRRKLDDTIFLSLDLEKNSINMESIPSYVRLQLLRKEYINDL